MVGCEISSSVPGKCFPRRRSGGECGAVDEAARGGAGARPAAPLAKCRYPWAGTR